MRVCRPEGNLRRLGGLLEAKTAASEQSKADGWNHPRCPVRAFPRRPQGAPPLAALVQDAGGHPRSVWLRFSAFRIPLSNVRHAP